MTRNPAESACAASLIRELPEDHDVGIDGDRVDRSVAHGKIANAVMEAAEDALPAVGTAGHVIDVLGEIEIVGGGRYRGRRVFRPDVAGGGAVVVAVEDA